MIKVFTVKEFFDEFHITHFKWSEFVTSRAAQVRGIDNSPTLSDCVTRLSLLALFLDGVRERTGVPIIISSAYRTEEVNKLVGGVPNSRHVKGLAVDIYHNRNYEQNFNLLTLYARWFHNYHHRGFFHVDFTEEFLLNNFYSLNPHYNETKIVVRLS